MQCWKLAVCQSNLFRKRGSELLQFLVCGGCKLSNTWIQFLYLSWSHRYVKISLQQNAKKIKLNNMDISISVCIPLSGNYDRPAYNVQQIKLTDVSFWVHVKIASRITSYRKVGLFFTSDQTKPPGCKFLVHIPYSYKPKQCTKVILSTGHTTFSGRAFPVTTAGAWNDHPPTIRASPLLLMFQQQREAFLSQSTFHWLNNDRFQWTELTV